MRWKALDGKCRAPKRSIQFGRAIRTKGSIVADDRRAGLAAPGESEGFARTPSNCDNSQAFGFGVESTVDGETGNAYSVRPFRGEHRAKNELWRQGFPV